MICVISPGQMVTQLSTPKEVPIRSPSNRFPRKLNLETDKMEMGTILGNKHLGQLHTTSTVTLLIPLVHGNLDQTDCSYIFVHLFQRLLTI